MNIQEIRVPDLGDFDQVDVIEVLVQAGDSIAVEDSLITVESDKASMEIPAPLAGVIQKITVEVGQAVRQGDVLAVLEMREEPSSPLPSTPLEAAADNEATVAPGNTQKKDTQPVHPDSPFAFKDLNLQPGSISHSAFKKAYATPSIRKFARQLGADLSRISGTGRKGRITREDVESYIKQQLKKPTQATVSTQHLPGIAPLPEIDFSQWGETSTQPLSRINKLTGTALYRNWMTIPHVTQFDQADITELEDFRKTLNAEQAQQNSGIKITPLAFILKAVIATLKALPRFNSSLNPQQDQLINKHYYHIGVAVDTIDGLVVPVVRDADQKSLLELSQEMAQLAQKARDKKIRPDDLQGGCFSVSSLGGIGGQHFTPIINAPEVAILGVSQSQIQPVWDGNTFTPRLMLPLSLSYDHRVIDGADGARFTAHLAKLLSDIRRLMV